MEFKFGTKKLIITNPEKILFPKAKITKQELVTYYQAAATLMLPHIKNRLVTMQRFPNGVTGEIFYQKDAGDYVAEWLTLQPVKKVDGGVVHYMVASNKATIGYLANLVCVPHVWLSRVPKLNYPDRMIFDLDPSPGADFALVKWAALELKELLESLGLITYVMTTGSRGVHVVVPIKKLYLFDDVRACAQKIAQLLVDKHPDTLTLAMKTSARGNKIFIDTLRNAWSATAVAPYSVRAKEGAPIAMPITWQELAPLKSSDHYTITNSMARIEVGKDPWKDINKKACTLAQAYKKLGRGGD